MSFITGYRIPGNPRGQAFTLPDFCAGLVDASHAERIAADLRQLIGKEPTWQAVRGRLIRIAKARMHTASRRANYSTGY
ncbi:MAG: hypothetical protein PHU46_12065 [Rhodocyclaceae bacterium]|nr:hypothetical protein [Rhodocyclaceae bacterium]